MRTYVCSTRRGNQLRELVTAETALTRRGLGVILLLLLAAPAVRQLKAIQPKPSGLQHSASSRSGGVLGRAPLASRQLVPARLQALYARLPLRFEPNLGQADPNVRFMARAPGYGLFLTDDGAVLALRSASPKRIKPAGIKTWVRMKWLGSAPSPRAAGLDKLASRSNYFIGDNPNLWRTGIPNYGRVAFRNVYPGIDLAYYGNPRQLEYDFRVAPGGNPNRLRFSLMGPSGRLPLHLDARGNLVAEIPGGLRFMRPMAYQEVMRRGRLIRRAVFSRYVLKGRGRAGILVGPYNRNLPLVIDPVLLYSTYLGGSGADGATSVAVDGSGDAFVTGGATSVNFPTANPLQKSNAGSSDVFIAELNPAGTSLVYSTYIGGSGFDKGTSIAIDSSGNAYVAGYTSSPNFPTTSKAFETSYQGNGKSEAFAMKLGASGASLIYATYLGGTGGDFGQGIAVDSAGDAYVTGSTQSADFPVAKPLQATIGGGSDAFVTELNPAGDALVYSTFLGGSQSDSGQAIAVDSAGEAYVTGFTLSTDFPTQNPLQSSSGGGSDAFVAKLNSGGSALLYSTYLGGNGEDRGLGIAVDSSGEAYVTGSTQSINFPVSSGAYQTAPGGSTDAFVAKLNSTGAQLVYATFLGGAQDDEGNGIALDASGDAYVIGSTSSANFPTLNPSQSTLGEGACTSTCSNAFVSVLNPQGSGLVYSTYLGGSGPDYGQGVAVDASGNAYVAGVAGSSNFPVVSGAFQGVYGSSGTSGNAFVAKISPNNDPSVALNPQAIDFGNEGMNATSPPQTVTLINVGSVPLTISSITTTGDFAQTNTCGGSLQAGGGQCTISVTFTPAAVAAETGDVVITDNAAGSPHQVSLSGTGVTPTPTPAFSPASLTFGSPQPVAVGTTSAAQAVSLTNTGSAVLNVTKLTVGGAFAQTNNCPATLAPAASCAISITFSPTGNLSSTSNNASLVLADGLTGTAPSVTLTGIAEADFALSASGLSSTPVIGTNSVQMTVSATSLLSSFTGALTLGCSGGGATCTFSPASISPGQTSTATVNGLSTAAASSNPLTITFTGTNSGATQSASVSQAISFQDYSLSASPPLATITAGQSATYTVTVTPISGFNQPLTFSCSSGLPGAAQCAFSPSSVTPSGGAPVNTTLTITTTAHSTSAGRTAPVGSHKAPPGGPSGMIRDVILLLMLLGLGLAARLREGKRVWLIAGILLLFTLLLAGCNMNYYGFLGSNPAPTGSPSGVYTVTISGNFTPATQSSSSVSATSRSTTVNLAIH